MNTIGHTSAEPQTSPPARQLAGAVAGRISKRLIYFLVALMVFVFLCGAPIWIGIAWWGADGDIMPSISLMPAAITADALVADEPAQLGYQAEAEATANCLPPARIEPVYRSRQTVGWSCVRSLD